MQHMQKALQQLNLKLPQVVSDITGATGMAILRAILAGARDPVTLAKLRNPHCYHDEDDIAKALQGTWRAEHLFALQQAVALYDCYHQQLALCDRQIKAHLETCADLTGKFLGRLTWLLSSEAIRAIGRSVKQFKRALVEAEEQAYGQTSYRMHTAPQPERR